MRNTYTIEDLAEMGLPGYPTTRKNWYEVVRREEWEFVESPGRGPGGVRREFKPPEAVREMIAAIERGEQVPAAKRKRPRSRQAGSGAITVSPVTAGVPMHLEVAQWLANLTRYAIEVPWMGNLPWERKRQLILDVYRVTLTFTEGNKPLVAALLEASDNVFETALHMVYQMDCVRSGIIPGSDLGLPAPYQER